MGRDLKVLGVNVDPKCISRGFARSSTDTWSVGVLLARCLVYINFEEDPSTVDLKWIKNIKKETRLNPVEKEVLNHLLEPRSSVRVKISDLLTNHYFLQILKYRKDLKNRLFKSYNLPDQDSEVLID